MILFLGLALAVPPVSAHRGDTVTLHQAVQALNQALVAKNTGKLKRLLQQSLSYGHSNGWQETKEEVIGNLQNGTLTYLAIEGKTGVVRMKGIFKVQLGNSLLQLKLSVMQVWIWQHRRWQLIGRQSATMN